MKRLIKANSDLFNYLDTNEIIDYAISQKIYKDNRTNGDFMEDLKDCLDSIVTLDDDGNKQISDENHRIEGLIDLLWSYGITTKFINEAYREYTGNYNLKDWEINEEMDEDLWEPISEWFTDYLLSRKGAVIEEAIKFAEKNNLI